LRHVDAEEEVVLAWIEVCRLTAIGRPGIEVVLRADGQGELLDMVPVQVAEHHVEAAIRDALPAFEDRHDGLTRIEADVQLGRLRLCEQRRHRDERRGYPQSTLQNPHAAPRILQSLLRTPRSALRIPHWLHGCCPGAVVVVRFVPLRASNSALYSSSV